MSASASRRRDDILHRIVDTKRSEVEGLPEAELRAAAKEAAPPRDFAGALAFPGSVSLIAEVKRRSPGAGAMRPELDPTVQAAAYEAGGARAISVLTDRTYFEGSLDDLRAVRGRVELPLLRKDFVIDPRQIYEARAAGADAILLIVRILDDDRLRDFRLLAQELGMAALVEVHQREELERALRQGATVVGVNNRDLRTFQTDLEVTLGLADRIPPEVTLVSESGISTREEVERLAIRGVDAVLVGEALVRAGDPETAARGLSGVPTPAADGAPEGRRP